MHFKCGDGSFVFCDCVCDFSLCSFYCLMNFCFVILFFVIFELFVSYLCVFHVVVCVAWHILSFMHVIIVLHLPLHDHAVVISRVL